MRLDDGRDVLVSLCYPLPLNVVPELLAAISEALQELGYTDIGIALGGSHQGAIIGTPPTTGELDELPDPSP